METRCGFRPIMGWPDANGLKEFAVMLLDICCQINREKGRVKEVSDDLLRQAPDKGQ